MSFISHRHRRCLFSSTVHRIQFICTCLNREIRTRYERRFDVNKPSISSLSAWPNGVYELSIPSTNIMRAQMYVCSAVESTRRVVGVVSNIVPLLCLLAIHCCCRCCHSMSPLFSFHSYSISIMNVFFAWLNLFETGDTLDGTISNWNNTFENHYVSVFNLKIFWWADDRPPLRCSLRCYPCNVNRFRTLLSFHAKL